MKILASTITIALFAVSAIADDKAMPTPSIPKSFEPLKQLIGTWQGVNQMGEQSIPMTVSYKLTSGGTAITETLMQGTPEEMVTVYEASP